MGVEHRVVTDAHEAYKQFKFTGYRYITLLLTELLLENYELQKRVGLKTTESGENHEAYGGIVVSNFNPIDNGGRPRKAYIVREKVVPQDRRPFILDETFRTVLREELRKDGALTLSQGYVESLECKFDGAVSQVAFSFGKPFEDIYRQFIDEPFVEIVKGKERDNFGTRTMNAMCLPQVGGGRTSLLRQSMNQFGVPKGVYQFSDTGLRRKVHFVHKSELPPEVPQDILDQHGFAVVSVRYHRTPNVEPVERTFMPVELIPQLTAVYEDHVKRYLLPQHDPASRTLIPLEHRQDSREGTVDTHARD